jgi:hypothetical protein
MSTINEAIVKVVIGKKGNTQHKWWRKSRTKWRALENQLFKVPNFYYAKVYRYEPIGRKKKGKRRDGVVHEQIGYIYWKDGILTTIIK